MQLLRNARAAGALALVFASSALACSEDAIEPQPVTFVIEVAGEQFSIRASDPAAIAGLEGRRVSGQRGAIMGQLASGDGGFNSPWSWHLEPGTIEVPDVAIEVCDGRPSMVESDTVYWIDTVGQFCPWGARVVSRQN
jgi:hypothetical protein